MAWSRQTSRPVDRIYGIIQADNLRVGKVIRPHDNTSLTDLTQDSIVALANKNSVLCQLFVHTAKPGEFSSWRNTEHSFVPANFRSATGYVLKARFHPESKQAMRASGRVCRLTDALEVQDTLVRLLKEIDKSTSAAFCNWDSHPARLIIMTDAGFTQEHLNPNCPKWELDVPDFLWLQPQVAKLPLVLHGYFTLEVLTHLEGNPVPSFGALLCCFAHKSAGEFDC
ncbi:hypothetical protein BDP55DRAFT_742761 [Colletotrichum godetiae]|uniref:Uncharacterized protein n=1 Tax=Colletotrichum godetiae TaxID=1209918 RepID=A0AAJ0EW40_9PEZI|nr:uncharacterized protein BDP55DRAFT_742761 [Colletotrichum godetiae]KAK1675983.1 hypothetical protein BDP55DRAFT_742761 [Colletotrichum godetiae]